jgi:transglutaminase-like putative cysteine protease
MAGRRLQITHRTGYRYADTVDASFNEVRMTPMSGDGQSLISHRLDIRPTAEIQSYVDYWGARVQAFDVHVPHRVLEVIATSTVETAGVPDEDSGLSWEELAKAPYCDLFSEYLVATEYVDLPADQDRLDAITALLQTATPVEGARRAVSIVRERMKYVPGVTHVGTTALQAWTTGNGVCQDFTHATLALLRGAGIPSRYVSGYLHTEEPAMGQTVVGESHAWVEYWAGTWRAMDPTNDRAVGGAHVVVARGRDYADVPPLKGIYAGGTSEGLGVSVEITQL